MERGKPLQSHGRLHDVGRGRGPTQKKYQESVWTLEVSNLVSLVDDRWGVMASRNPLDELPAEAKARLRELPQPTWVAPMLATLTDERFSREGWLFEPKWDGERCLAFRRRPGFASPFAQPEAAERQVS